MGKGSENAKDCSHEKQTGVIGGCQKKGRSGAGGEMGKGKGSEKECLIGRLQLSVSVESVLTPYPRIAAAP
jgi:hypothetical protein